MHKKNLFVLFTIFSYLFFSCSSKKSEFANYKNRIVIWTSNPEIVQYIELFNETHETKAILVYKENFTSTNLENSFEDSPDIIIAPYLRNKNTKKNFESINYLFDRKYLNQKDFYSGLLKFGEINNKYYLLPVNFNLPTIIFSKENSKFIPNDYTISPENLLKIGESFNKKNSRNQLTRLGFSPLSSDEFLYTFSRMNETEYKESKKNYFSYKKEKLNETINLLIEMTTLGGITIQESNDFVYKYLSIVDTKRVTSGRTLFAHTTSDKFFNLPQEQISKVDYRWLEKDNLIPVEDSMVLMGISKSASNYSGSIEFMSWFFETETQKKFLELKNNLTSDLLRFGIAGGFSSIKDVNQKILPTYYKNLLSNIPQEGSLKIPDPKPIQWEEIKQTVILPYIKESILNAEVQKSWTAENDSIKINPVKSIEERMKNKTF